MDKYIFNVLINFYFFINIYNYFIFKKSYFQETLSGWVISGYTLTYKPN